MLGHTAAHVRVAGEVEVLEKDAVGSFWKLQEGCGNVELHVGVVGEAGDIVFEYDLLVAHLCSSHCHSFFTQN